jgi:Sulfotransferase family
MSDVATVISNHLGLGKITYSAETAVRTIAAPKVPHDPVFVLAAPRSFTSVIGTILGQHPEMYGLPETHLFSYETMAERWEACLQATYPMSHGLLRAVAQLFFGGQSTETIKWAQGWLRRRCHLTSGMLLEELALRVYPRILVDKSPSIAYRRAAMQRAYEMFPQAKFIHLVRHPRAHGESIMKYIQERKRHGPIPRSHWLIYFATYPHTAEPAEEPRARKLDLDPQFGWHVVNSTIRDFLETVPANQKMTVRGEDLLTDPDQTLAGICAWLALRTDPAAIDEMKHPERSPYACIGPEGARYGNDVFFLEDPVLRPSKGKQQSLDGPLSWRSDGREFTSEVKDLARQLGYQ